MGITGLWKIVEPTGTEIPLECLEGKKLAIDVSIWIYQAQTAYPADQPYPHLRLLVSRLAKLLFYKIRPVFVFDGPQVPHLKRRVLEMRRTRKLEEDDILKNTQKMKSLKEIASGQLQGAALESTIQKVISPSKRILRKREEDVYKDIGATSSNLELEERIHFDRMNYSGDSEGEEDGEGGEAEDQDSDVEILMEPVEKVEVEEKEKEEEIPEKPVRNQTPSATRREEIQNLLDKREFIRNSRLRPEMIPADSKTFSNFQMQRLLQRGRLNEQIEKLAKSSNTTGFLTSDKINVTGPDGTRHVLQHAYQDEIQHLQPEIQGNREIDSLYRKQPIEMTLDIFNVEYGGKKYSREGTPDDAIEEGLEKKFSSAGSNYREYQSKSGMLEAIARKRIRQHYGTGEVEKRRKRHQEEEEEVIGDVSDDEMAFQAVLLESASKNLEDKMKPPPSSIPGTSKDSEEVEWDPQRYDPQPSTSSDFRNLMNNSRDNNDETTKTPELYRDLQEFLTNCGIPWIEAPGEAEAQCVELEKLKLVDGVVTDDSDVWAFGVRHVYRHMFSKNRRVQRYGETTAANRDNLRKFCLQREDYISIALLSGGDYCPGLNKVGAIGALELVAEFIDEKRDEQQDGSVEQIENRVSISDERKPVFLKNGTRKRKRKHISNSAETETETENVFYHSRKRKKSGNGNGK
uniref:Uncharacterized protein n=1 Tax=Caenorhabditis japonica TaxID=281687 RepID=A0A8R1DGM0_CAEJA